MPIPTATTTATPTPTATVTASGPFDLPSSLVFVATAANSCSQSAGSGHTNSTDMSATEAVHLPPLHQTLPPPPPHRQPTGPPFGVSALSDQVTGCQPVSSGQRYHLQTHTSPHIGPFHTHSNQAYSTVHSSLEDGMSQSSAGAYPDDYLPNVVFDEPLLSDRLSGLRLSPAATKPGSVVKPTKGYPPTDRLDRTAFGGSSDAGSGLGDSSGGGGNSPLGPTGTTAYANNWSAMVPGGPSGEVFSNFSPPEASPAAVAMAVPGLLGLRPPTAGTNVFYLSEVNRVV
ncbi:unnamed protein product [Protopolystoma xenopodis]|uniref:Uncharacterized protein n=1 Tax=Protopolystoma xenopodis TaxID=117903 RepID=A0A3S5AN22_9PLAT|nr:unnamed protein product [Protopolystoma xenopodis]